MKNYLLEERNKDYQLYRRPGILWLGGDRLIAWYEAQIADPLPRQALFCRISEDGGESFGERILITEGGSTGMLHNIMMAADGDRIYCLYNVQYRQLWCLESSDGRSFENPRDLTRMLWRAQTDYPWNAFGIGSGHCIVDKTGRILIPTWFTTGGDTHKPSGFGNIYSDDGFKTIHIGKIFTGNPEGTEGKLNVPNPNEGAGVLLPDGDMLMTIRHDSDLRERLFAKSPGGIGEFKEVCFRNDLPDPVCHASFAGAHSAWGEDIIFFANCANPDEERHENIKNGTCRYSWSDDARKDLTLRSSRDGGRSFSQGILIAQKGGYSDIAVTKKGVVCIYETGWDKDDGSCTAPKEIGICLLDKSSDNLF